MTDRLRDWWTCQIALREPRHLPTTVTTDTPVRHRITTESETAEVPDQTKLQGFDIELGMGIGQLRAERLADELGQTCTS
jgi:hypothetical protein